MALFSLIVLAATLTVPPPLNRAPPPAPPEVWRPPLTVRLFSVSVPPMTEKMRKGGVPEAALRAMTVPALLLTAR